MKTLSLTLILLSFIALSANADLSPAGLNAKFHTKVCSPDGLLLCLTRVSNYVVNNKRYDIRFKFNTLSKLLPQLKKLSVSSGNTHYDNGPSGLSNDLSAYMTIHNRDYIDYDPITDTFASDTKTVFATSNLVHKSERPSHYTNFRWDASQPSYPLWMATEYNDWLPIVVEKGRSITYFYGVDVVILGNNPERIGERDGIDFYVVSKVKNLTLCGDECADDDEDEDGDYYDE